MQMCAPTVLPAHWREEKKRKHMAKSGRWSTSGFKRHKMGKAQLEMDNDCGRILDGKRGKRLINLQQILSINPRAVMRM